MKPVRTEGSNFVYVGPPGVGDLHCDRIRPGVIQSVWQLTDQERGLVAQGANILLTIATEPIPPVAVDLTWQKGIGEDAPELHQRLEDWRASQR